MQIIQPENNSHVSPEADTIKDTSVKLLTPQLQLLSRLTMTLSIMNTLSMDVLYLKLWSSRGKQFKKRNDIITK